jgi:hypothetical protein
VIYEPRGDRHQQPSTSIARHHLEELRHSPRHSRESNPTRSWILAVPVNLGSLIMIRFGASSVVFRFRNSFGRDRVLRVTAVTAERAFLGTIVRLSSGGAVPLPATRLSPDRLRELARAGAATAVKELRAEITAIENAFPELRPSNVRKAAIATVGRVQRRSRKMSAAARKAVSLRMQKYWAERRKARGKKT